MDLNYIYDTKKIEQQPLQRINQSTENNSLSDIIATCHTSILSKAITKQFRKGVSLI